MFFPRSRYGKAAAPKPSFTLRDTSGAAFNFRSKTGGYVTLLFFGYAHCPAMCPLQMWTRAQALKALPRAKPNEFKVAFVTTDPERDTPASLRAGLDQFNKSFIGLTGSEVAIHAAWVLAYTKDNLCHVIYPDGVKEEDQVHDLLLLATER